MVQPLESFSKLIVWQKAHELVLAIYRCSLEFPKVEHFGLTSQIRRAAVSVTSNIAEGYKRRSRAEKRQFFYIAVGSLEEVKSQLLIARDLGYLEADSYEITSALSGEVSRLLQAWIGRFELNP